MEHTTPTEATLDETYSGTDFLKLADHTGELQPLRNSGDEVNRKNILHRVLNQRTYITADLDQVIYGTFNQSPACLIVFNFKFRFDADSRLRFKKAEITVSFNATPDGVHTPSPNDDPIIYNFAPKKLYGNSTVENHTWTYGIALPCMISSSPIQLGVQPQIKKELSFQKGHRMEISGRGFQGPQNHYENEVVWTLKENGKLKNGIPDQLKSAVIVGAQQPFQATIEVKAEADFKLVLFGWPWSKDDPVLFRPGKSFGMPLEIPRWFPYLDTIKDDEWAEIVPQWTGWDDMTGSPSEL